MPRTRLHWAATAGLAIAAWAGTSYAQVNDQVPRNALTGDLAALCATATMDAAGATARAWCHGFIISAAQYHGSISSANPATGRVYCVPDPNSLTLDSVRSAFVTWSQSNPQYANDRAIDGLMRFAATTWPCPAPATPAAAGRRH